MDLLGPCTNKCLSDCLCSCKDRASERHRPNARKKKIRTSPFVTIARLCGCVLPTMDPVSLSTIKDRRILAIPGIHFFDAHRLQPQLLQAPALQLPLRTSNLAGPEAAGEAVEDPSSDEERATTDGETDVAKVLEDADLPPEKPWCPPGCTAHIPWTTLAMHHSVVSWIH